MKEVNLKSELKNLVVGFFQTSDIIHANKIKDSIYQKVLSCSYSISAQQLLDNSLSIWRVDVSNYLTSLDSNSISSNTKHQAYLALIGIINLIEFSKEYK